MTTICALVGGGGSGSMPLGSGPFGSAFPSDQFSVELAEVVSANQVCVSYLSEIPAGSPCSSESPLSVYAWELSVVDPPGVCAPFVQTLEVNEETQEICFFFDRLLECGVTYRLRFLPNSMLGCSDVIFTGFCVAESAKLADARSDDGFIRDIANPFVASDAIQVPQMALGTYEISSTGDLAQDSGVSSLRKRIMRRATVVAGEFFHAGSYGADLEPKRFTRPDLLRRYQEKLKVQISREPEVRAVSVSISPVVGNPNVVAVYIRAQTASGSPIDLSVPITLP